MERMDQAFEVERLVVRPGAKDACGPGDAPADIRRVRVMAG
jgi:hypothetical protein